MHLTEQFIITENTVNNYPRTSVCLGPHDLMSPFCFQVLYTSLLDSFDPVLHFLSNNIHAILGTNIPDPKTEKNCTAENVRLV